MNAIEKTLDELGKLGISQDTPEFPDEGSVKKRYKVNYAPELNEYCLVFWYGKWKKPNFHTKDRYSNEFDEILFVTGQYGFIFLYQKDSRSGKKIWDMRHNSGINAYYDYAETDDELIEALNRRNPNLTKENPLEIIEWEREIKRLAARESKLLQALQKIGKQWVTQQPPDAKKGEKHYYSAIYNQRSGLHSLALWKGNDGSFPWIVDIYDADWSDFFENNVRGKHAEILVATYGYNKREIVGYVTDEAEFYSIDEVATYIQENLDGFFVSRE